VRGTDCGVVAYWPVMWTCVHTAYRGASCVKLYVAGHLGCCIVQWGVSQSIIALPHLDIHCVTSTALLSLCFVCSVSVSLSHQLWPRSTSAVQWRCCHVKDFTLATPLFCDRWGQGVPKNWTPWWSTGSVFCVDYRHSTMYVWWVCRMNAMSGNQ